MVSSVIFGGFNAIVLVKVTNSSEERIIFNPADESDTFFRNVGTHLKGYTAL
jgi:hypothetical protein